MRLYTGKIKLELVPLAPKKPARVPWAAIGVVVAIGTAIWTWIILGGR